MRLPRSRFLRAILATLTFAILNLTTHSQAFSATATFVTFDVPGAGAGSYQGTSPSSINLEGEITGLYIDASSLAHGFLRSPLGFLTTFDAPGEINGTYPSSINLLGAVTGYYYDVNFVGHGFLRSSNGTFTTFDAPGAVAGMIGTFPSSINLEGTITGYYYDTNFVSHGFLRSSNGTFTTFDAPGAGTTTSPQGTTPEALNPLGVIAGIATDSSNFSNGFLRDSHGSFTTFDAPGSLSTFFPLSPFSFSVPDLSINLEGETTGAIFKPFRETRSGAITMSLYGPPMALSPHSMQRTIPLAVYGRSPLVLTRPERSRECSTMAITSIMASCGSSTVR